MLLWSKHEGDPLLLLLHRIWFGCLSERQQKPRSASCLSPPAFIFPSSYVPEWVERNWRDWAPPPPPQAYRDLLGLQQAVALLFSLDLQRCTQSGFKLAVGFFFNLWIFLYFATALLSAGCSRPATNGLYFGLAGQATVFLGVRQVSLRKEAARRNMSVMLCRWEQNNFTMKLVGWTLPDHHKGQPPIRNQKTVYFSSWLCI